MDAFCGSGSVGVEALSRGGAGCVFVDLSPDACAVAARNAETCGFSNKYETCARDVLVALRDEALRGPGLDLLTLTPPYEEIDYDELMASVASSPLLNADCVVVVEYPVERGKPPFRIGELVGVRNRRYGRTALAFYAFKPPGALEALRPRNPVDRGPCVCDESSTLVLAGDYCTQSSFLGAYASSLAAAEAVHRGYLRRGC